MDRETFFLIVGVTFAGGTGMLLYALIPLINELYATMGDVHRLVNRVDPNINGVLDDAKRIMDDAVVLTGSIVKQKQSLDSVISTVGYAIGHTYGRVRQLLGGAVGKVKGLLGSGEPAGGRADAR